MLEDSIFPQPRKDLSHPSPGPHSSPVQQQQKVTLQRTQGGLGRSEEQYSHGHLPCSRELLLCTTKERTIMLGPHFPPPTLGPSEGRPAPCTFQIPDGSYRCLALEAEESSSEDGQQGEVRLADLEEDVASRHRASRGTPQLSRASDVIQPSSCSREARGGFQHGDRTSHDWDVVRARKVMTVSDGSSPGSRVAQKPGKLISLLPRVIESPTGS